MGQESRPVEETGTYSTYVNGDDLEIIREIGLEGLGPGKLFSRLAEKAKKFEENKAERVEKINELEDEIHDLKEKNKA